jgi:hypothetical protein
MNLKRCFTAALGAAVLMSACTKVESLKVENDGSVQFLPSISKNPSTKASGDAFANDDKVGVYMVDGKTPNVVVEGNANWQYKIGDGVNSQKKLIQVSGIMYYPVSGDDVNFRAYYPYKPTGDGSDETTIKDAVYQINVTSQTDLPAIDLLYAVTSGTGYNKNNTSDVPLTFNHQLSDVISTIEVGEGMESADLSKMAVTVKGLNTEATFNLLEGTLGSPSSAADIVTYKSAAGKTYEAIAIPQTFIADQVMVEFSGIKGLDNVDTLTGKFSADEFKSGEKYTYTVKLNRHRVDFEPVTIVDWVIEDKGSMNAD